MMINGEMPKTGNTTLEEGEYTVQCLAAGFYPREANLSIHLSKGNEPQTVTTRVRELDDDFAGTYRLLKYLMRTRTQLMSLVFPTLKIAQLAV